MYLVRRIRLEATTAKIFNKDYAYLIEKAGDPDFKILVSDIKLWEHIIN